MDIQSEVLEPVSIAVKPIETILFILDTQNIYYSARALHGDKSRVDFHKLKEIASKSLSLSLFKAVALVADFKTNDDTFLGVLRKFGYEIVMFSKSAPPTIEEIIQENRHMFDHIVVGSGSGELIDTYLDLGKDNVTVVSFPDSLHSGISKVVGETIYLDSNVLLQPKK